LQSNLLKQHWAPFSNLSYAISLQKYVIEKMWYFVWLDIDSSLQTNDSKQLDSSCDSTLTQFNQVMTLTLNQLEKISDDSDSKGLW